MQESLQEKIHKFAESTYKEESRFPGKLYQVTTRITDESEGNLLFNRTLLERYYSQYTESAVEYNDTKYAIRQINEELEKRRSIENSFKWQYIFCPYFTETEMPTSLIYSEARCERPFNDEREDEGINCLNYGNKIKELELKLKDTDDPDDINDIKTELISLGWNPEVEMNEANIIKAKDRIERIYTQQMNELCDFINISEDIFAFDPNNSKRVSVLNEAKVENDIVPLFIIIKEDEILLLNKVDDGYIESTIYNIFVDRDIRDNLLMLENTYKQYTEIFNNGVFTFPDNYRAFQIISMILEAYQFYDKPIIYKCKDALQNLNAETINSYTRHLANKPIYDYDIENYLIYHNAAVLYK